MANARVLDADGTLLSPCTLDRADDLLAAGKARLISQVPLTIRLVKPARGHPRPKRRPDVQPGAGKQLLLHTCCAPCSTYCVQRLRTLGFQLTAHWYNPNIHPSAEHEQRRMSLYHYAARVALPVLESSEPEDEGFRAAIREHERRPERCAICYRLRLEATARLACQRGCDAFSTTLLISPFQLQDLIRATGEELAARYGVAFYFENMRRGWGERTRLAQEYGLYLQQYCGCALSAEEARQARTQGSVALPRSSRG